MPDRSSPSKSPGGKTQGARSELPSASPLADVVVPRRNPKNAHEPLEWQVVLARVLALHDADQLRVHGALTEILANELVEEGEEARELRLRREALECLVAAAEHLGPERVPDGAAPSSQDYKDAYRELAELGRPLPMTFAAVYRAFEQRWHLASAYYRNERMPLAARQRAFRRARIGIDREGTREHSVSGVRMFLESNPPSATIRDYGAWAEEYNAQLPIDGVAVSTQPTPICQRLQLDWEDVLRVARNERSLEEARAEFLQRHLATAGPLVSLKMAGAMLGLYRVRWLQDFPPVAAIFKGGQRGWLRTDVEAYRDGKRDFPQEPATAPNLPASGPVTDLSSLPAYIDMHVVGRILGLSPVSVKKYSTIEAVHLCPPPTGRIGGRNYWTRDEVIAWLAENPQDERPKSVWGQTGKLTRPPGKSK